MGKVIKPGFGSKTDTLLVFLFLSASIFLVSCTDPKSEAERTFSSDQKSQQVLNNINLEIRDTNSVGSESFSLLAEIQLKYPGVPSVEKTYKAALFLRDDLDGLKEFQRLNPDAEFTVSDRENFAKLYFRHGEFTESVKLIDELILSSPKNTEYRGIAAKANFSLGKLEETAGHLDEVWETLVREKDSESIALRGLVYFRKGELPKAKETLTLAVQLDPKSIQANYTLSRVYGELGNKNLADSYRSKTEELQKSLRLETLKNSKQALRARDLQAAWKLKDYPKVIELGNEMLPETVDPKQKSVIYLYLSESHKALGNTAESDKALAEAKKLGTK